MLDHGKELANVEEPWYLSMEADDFVQFSLKSFPKGEKRFTIGVMKRVMSFVTNLLPAKIKSLMFGIMLAKQLKMEPI